MLHFVLGSFHWVHEFAFLREFVVSLAIPTFGRSGDAGTIQAFIEHLAIVNRKYAKTLSSHRGAEERWRWLRLPFVHAWSGIEGMAMAVASFAPRAFALRSTSDAVHFFPVQPQSAERPATTEGEWRRRHSSQGHKAGPLIVLPSTTYCGRVVLLTCRCEMCNRIAVTTVVTGPNRERDGYSGLLLRKGLKRSKSLLSFVRWDPAQLVSAGLAAEP